jgi:chaperonin GroEL
MSKITHYGNDARERILAGAKKLAKTVGTTMGPYGRNVLIGRAVGAPIITKDGVSVAREVVLEDPIEELGNKIIKEVSGRTADVAGDGTTTATVLAAEIFEGGMTLMREGGNPIHFRDGINHALSLILKEINSFSVPISSESIKDLRSIATISANNDSEIGNAISSAFEAVGLHGVVTAEATPGRDTHFRVTDGLEIRAGYCTPALLNQGEDPITLESPYILICDRDITHVQDFMKVLSDLHENNKSILIIAKSFRQEALQTIIVNRKAGRLNAVAVEYPVFGKNNEQWLDDLSILVGTSVYSENKGNPLSQATVSSLGKAEKVKISRYSTTIINGDKNQQAIAEKQYIYLSTLDTAISDSDRKDIRSRLAFLQNKAAVVCVGYSTEAELREKGDRVEDAVCATKAALEGGILPGGGNALLIAARRLNIGNIPVEFQSAALVLKNACEKPFFQILDNSYIDPTEILDKIINQNDPWFGYNLVTKEFGNMLDLGVVDPKKVTETALKNAVSAALLLINTEAVLAENPDRPSGWQAPAGWRPPSDTNLNHQY